MKKVKNIYYTDDKNIIDSYSTGLLFELEDGKIMQQLSTDVIVPYAHIKDKKTLAYIREITGNHTKPHDHIKQLNDKYCKKLKDTCMHGDCEIAHMDADDILIDILKELGGFDDTIQAYSEVGKWYA